jgi:hypothetical protein
MQHNNLDQDTKSIFKEWVEKLQQESWQLELLISGFAIFGIYSARTLIADLSFFRDNELFGDIGTAFSLIIFIFKTGWLIFFLNLVIHVILRGLWIGTIGLRYVSQEIDYDSLGYAERFTQYLKKKVGSYDDFIERLEKICSVLFAFTFLLFLLFVSLMLFVIQLLLLTTLLFKVLPNEEQFIGLIIIIFVFFGGIVFIDFITLGSLKKIKERHVSKIYFYIYRFYTFITLSFLYRPLLYNFIDNKYTRKLFYLSIPYIFLIIGGYRMFENNPNPYYPDRDIQISNGVILDDYYYDDLRNNLLMEYPNEERKINKKLLKSFSMESFEITKSTSSIFIKLDKNMKKIMEQDSTITPYRKDGMAFSWFSANILDDKGVELLVDQREKEIVALINQRKEITKKYKSDPAKGKILKDSITLIIDTRSSFWEKEIANYESKKINKIIDKYVSNIKFQIDTMTISLEQCYFYSHPHYQEQGLKCFFNTDSLSTGVHQIKFFRNIFDKTDEIIKDSIILPIIKQ